MGQRCRHGAVDATVERLRAHDDVCAAALAVGDTPLPIRFGQTFGAMMPRDRRDRLTRKRRSVSRCEGVADAWSFASSSRKAATTNVSDDLETSVRPSGIGIDAAIRDRVRRFFSVWPERDGPISRARWPAKRSPCSSHRERNRSWSINNAAKRLEGWRSFRCLSVERTSSVSAALAEKSCHPNKSDLSVLGPFAPYSFSGDA